MKSRSLRLWLAAILLILSLILLTFSLLPAQRGTQTVPLPAVSLPTPSSLVLPADWSSRA